MRERSANEALLDRIEAIEARQRDRQMHDPECPARIAQRYNSRGLAYMIPGECDCWLTTLVERL